MERNILEQDKGAIMTEQNRKILKDLNMEQLKKLCKNLNIIIKCEDTKIGIIKKNIKQ